MTVARAIVTGAPGWLGSQLIRSLLSGAPQRPVVALVLDEQQQRQVGELGSTVVPVVGDLTDRSSLTGLFESAEGGTVFHCAGVVHPTRGTREFYQVNVEGTRNLLDAAVRAGARRFVHVSSNSPVGLNPSKDTMLDETSPCRPYMNYGRSKKLAEDLVNEAGARGRIETVIVRPPWFYGPGQPPRQTLFFTMIKTGRVPIVGDGSNLRSMVYIDNLCQGLMLAESVPEAGSHTYWIADRRPYSFNEIVDTIESVLEENFHIEVAHKRLRLPGEVSEFALLADSVLQSCGLYHQKIHVLSEMNKTIACSVAKAESELGYSPEIELAEGMRRSIAWILETGGSI